MQDDLVECDDACPASGVGVDTLTATDIPSYQCVQTARPCGLMVHPWLRAGAS
jgi:hypothetical protein